MLIHSQTRTWHDKNIETKLWPILCSGLLGYPFASLFWREFWKFLKKSWKAANSLQLIWRAFSFVFQVSLNLLESKFVKQEYEDKAQKYCTLAEVREELYINKIQVNTIKLQCVSVWFLNVVRNVPQISLWEKYFGINVFSDFLWWSTTCARDPLFLDLRSSMLY